MSGSAAALEVLASAPEVFGIEVGAAWAELVLGLDVEGILEPLAEGDQRAAVAVIAVAVFACERPAAVELRARAANVVTPMGRGPVVAVDDVARVWLWVASLLEILG